MVWAWAVSRTWAAKKAQRLVFLLEITGVFPRKLPKDLDVPKLFDLVQGYIVFLL